jgi:hypothetical protein
MTSYVVSLTGFTPGARYDSNPWTQAQIGEAATAAGPFTTIDTIVLSPVDADPTNPQPRNVTTTKATLTAGWYQVTFIDAAGNTQPVPTPVPYPPPAMSNQGYCSIAQVQARNAARTLSATSQPNVAQVQQFILDTAAELDAILINKGYVVPVSPAYPEAFSLMSGLNAIGAWYMMENSAGVSPNLDRARSAWEEAKGTLERAQTVMDAPKNQDRAGPRAPWLTWQPSGEYFDPFAVSLSLTGGTTHGGAHSNPANPYFTRGQQY